MKCQNYLKFLYLFIFLVSSSIQIHAQETNSNISGRVLSNKNEILAGATVVIIHEPTQNKYISVTRLMDIFISST